MGIVNTHRRNSIPKKIRMKTLQQVQANRDRLMKFGATADESEKKKIRKHLAFLRPIITYLEHSPTKESVERQLDECLTKQIRINHEFNDTFPAGCDHKTRQKWMEANGMKDLKKRIETLSYILSNKELW